jgi:hypothetical protein
MKDMKDMEGHDVLAGKTFPKKSSWPFMTFTALHVLIVI